MPNRVKEKGDNIGYHGNKQDEFAKLLAAPCSFKISATKVDNAGADCHRHQVVLHQCASQNGPGISYALGRNEDEVGNGPLRAGEVVGGRGW